MEYEYIIQTNDKCSWWLQDYVGEGIYYVQGEKYVVLTNTKDAK